MKNFEDYVKQFLEDVISDARIKYSELVTFKPILDALENILVKYDQYFPKERLINELETIKQDKFFKTPVPVNLNAPLVSENEVMRKYNLLTWDKRILRRFSLYAFTRAWIEVLRDHKEKYEFDKKIHDTFIFVLKMYEVTKIGIHHFSTITLNSKDQHKAKSRPVGTVEPLIDAFKTQTETLKASIERMKTMNWSEEKTITFFDYIFKLDISVIEKDIFYGILEDFEITKLKNGTPSKRYQVLLLSNLFRHTHPQLYHEQGSSTGNRSKDDLNYESLWKLINSPGSSLFE